MKFDDKKYNLSITPMVDIVNAVLSKVPFISGAVTDFTYPRSAVFCNEAMKDENSRWTSKTECMLQNMHLDIAGVTGATGVNDGNIVYNNDLLPTDQQYVR